VRPGRAAVVLAALLVAGCETLEAVKPAAILAPERPTPPPAPRVTAGGELVAYLARIRDMGERPLAAETARQREAARAAGNDVENVKLALALALVPAADEGEIVTLMEPVARKPTADDDVRALASFLLVQAAERRRLKEGAAAAGSRLRDERRAHEAQKQRADALQERAAQLQQKIEALTELEKSLSDRQVQNR
jgi:hypothetical protein